MADRSYAEVTSYWPTFDMNGYKNSHAILYNVLKQHYPSDHEVTIYEAPPYSIWDSIIQRIPLKKMPEAVVSAMSTVCSSIGKIFQRQSNVGPVPENHQRVMQQL